MAGALRGVRRNYRYAEQLSRDPVFSLHASKGGGGAGVASAQRRNGATGSSRLSTSPSATFRRRPAMFAGRQTLEGVSKVGKARSRSAL